MLNAKQFALASGVFWGALLFLCTILEVVTGGYAHDFVAIWTGIYPGYTLTMGGSVVGLIYGFIDGFIGGYIFVWLYNSFGKKA